MTKPRKMWEIRPVLKDKPRLTAEMKIKVATKAQELIEKVLKPRYVLPPDKDQEFNYISDIGAKWFRNNFYFFSTYTCPSPRAMSPNFEAKFARMEPIGNGKFALYFMRYTGKEWVGVYDQLSVDECLEAIQEDEWFAL